MNNLIVKYACDNCSLELKKIRGCYKDVEQPLFYGLDGEHEIKQCPYSFIENWSINLIDMFYECYTPENGIKFYPDGKSLREQPYLIVESFKILSREYQNITKVKINKAKKNG